MTQMIRTFFTSAFMLEALAFGALILAGLSL
jgi:hypothetical protein